MANNTNTQSNPIPSDKVNLPSDGRGCGEWKTRYGDATAQKEIKWERNYLIILLAILIIIGALFSILFSYKNQLEIPLFKSSRFYCYVFAWIGGSLGGSVFAAKWLYHTVANGYWNQDRQLWRIFAPHLSGVFALMIIILFSCNFFSKENHFFSIHQACGIGFLVGYFSDNAIGKLSELANVFFSK